MDEETSTSREALPTDTPETEPAVQVGDPIEVPYTETVTDDQGNTVMVGYPSGGAVSYEGGVGEAPGAPVIEEGPQGFFD
jgi:hypothetical protein